MLLLTDSLKAHKTVFELSLIESLGINEKPETATL